MADHPGSGHRTSHNTSNRKRSQSAASAALDRDNIREGSTVALNKTKVIKAAKKQKQFKSIRAKAEARLAQLDRKKKRKGV